MIFRSGQSLPMGEAGQSSLVRRIRELREDLNWYYHRIELEQLGAENNAENRIAILQEQAQAHAGRTHPSAGRPRPRRSRSRGFYLAIKRRRPIPPSLPNARGSRRPAPRRG